MNRRIQMTESYEKSVRTSLRRSRRISIARHTRVTRLTHWINLFCVVVLLMSGLQIFNAHPALYWGQSGADPKMAFFEIGAADRGEGQPAGFTRIGSWVFETTGILGVSYDAAGDQMLLGFPGWMTIPSWRALAWGRRWHFFFAWLFVVNLLIYITAGVFSGHFRRDLLPSRAQLRRRSLLHDIANHLRLKFPQGEAARTYNPLQKLTYLTVIFGLLPLMILTGLAMSPGMDAILPWLVDVFGGRQSARTFHFITASLIVLFVFVHIVMVLLSSPVNGLRSMFTGKFMLSLEDRHD